MKHALPAGVPPDQTTLPRYGPPALGPAPHVVLSVGAQAAGVATELLTGRSADRHRTLDDGACDDDAGLASVVHAELNAVGTGWRVAAVGSETDVQAVRAAALACGALDSEIVLVPLDAADPMTARSRRLFCGFCHRRFDARAAVGDAVTCPGCRSALAVAHHHSRTHGAFLGVPTGTPG